ncbi:MAG: UDP-N-acetylmuramoyl-L-alanine--D-glutamate ligase [Fuerstiella sp.]
MTHAAISGPEDLKNLKVTIMGLGRFGGGIAAVRYLVNKNAVVTVTDQLPERQLQKSLAQIADLPLKHVFWGDHPDEAFTDCQLLVVNPAVKPDHPVLQKCDAAGIPVITEIQLLVLHLRTLGDQSRNSPDVTKKLEPAAHQPSAVQVVAVTGSNGKSTTAALIQHFLNADFKNKGVSRRCWLGGNVGGSLLSDVSRIQVADVVVLELSSFQLHHLRGFDFAPDVSVLTSFSSNHLDWHPDLKHYQASKQILFGKQNRTQMAVLPSCHITNGQRSFGPEHDEEDQPTWRIRCQEMRFGIVDDGQDGVFWEENSLVVRRQGVEDAVRMSLPASLSGEHSLHNLTAAACAAVQVGADPIAFPNSVASFRGLPYRLAVCGQNDTLMMVNDSAATTPESTIAAVKTLRQTVNRRFGRGLSSTNGTTANRPAVPNTAPYAQVGRLIVIVGGADKGSDLSQLASQLNDSADGVVAIGDVANTLATLVKALPNAQCETVVEAVDFESAFAQAVELVASTGIVLLSPGCSSFGWFRDYVDRGQQFDLLVEQWMQK